MYDVSVIAGDTVVAEFVGRSREIGGHVWEESAVTGTGEVPHLTRAALEALQLERLRDSLRRAATVPHYATAFGAAGVSPDDLSSLADLARFPFTTKADLRANYPFGMFAVPREQVARVHASSGTTGKPTVVGYTARTSTPGPR